MDETQDYKHVELSVLADTFDSDNEHKQRTKEQRFLPGRGNGILLKTHI